VGLGMFGLDGSSVVSAGVRVAQFVSKQNIDINAQPDVRYPSGPLANEAAKYTYTHTKIHLHTYSATETDKESFHGLGPKLDWTASMPVIGNEQTGELTFDWGANLAVLFGRQKASGSHQSAVESYYLTRWTRGFAKNSSVHPGCFGNAINNCSPLGDHHVPPTNQHTNPPQIHRRSRMVAVPNLGGFLGISMKYNNAKVSFGYRADEFFGAMDGGIDTHKSYDRGFNGPYATLSIGLGG